MRDTTEIPHNVYLRSLGHVLALVLSLLALEGLAIGQANPAQRPFQVNDLFDLEGIGRYFGGPYAFSADGKRLAITRVRPQKSLSHHKWEYLWDNAGGDVWVQMSAGSTLVNITNGTQDGSGWWAPQWSPDGSKLAMLSTRGGNVTLWVWEAESKTIRQLTTQALDVFDIHERQFLWVDANHILCPVLPAGEYPDVMVTELRTPMVATKEWPKVDKGNEATASVLESGVPIHLESRAQSDLLLLDTDKEDSKKVVLHGSIRSLQISPDHKYVAFTRKVSLHRPTSNESLGFDSTVLEGSVSVGIVALNGTAVPIHGDVGQDVLRDSLRWSPEGSELVYFGYAGSHNEAPNLYRLNLVTGTVNSQSLKTLDVSPPVREASQVEWSTNGNLILRAAVRLGDKKPDAAARRDWWVVGSDGAQRCLTADLKEVPGQLWPQEGREAFVGIAEKKLWQIEPISGRVHNLTENFAPAIDRITWPSMTNSGTDEYRQMDATYSRIIVSASSADSTSPYLLDFQSEKLTSIETPAPKADLVAYEPMLSTAIFYSADRNGLQVWRNDVNTNKSTVLFTANGFLRGVSEGEFRSFEYTSLNGEKLTGWMILPYGYQEGKRYPLLTWVYAGLVYGRRPPDYWGINSKVSLNLQIPATHGYVVLLPSMPLAKEGLADDPMLRLPEGVLPAVQKLVDLGIADSERLFLMGQSFGGFSAYGLVTQTQRFKAAISLAGLSDLVSLYGTFDARKRYTEFPQENLFQASLLESSQLRMGNPPWKDWGRYTRNSPIFYVDRVQTPLMIIQGDMDYIAIQQGEEFFMALYRQGKRAEFVRYWGEGHSLQSPANIRDMWNRIFAWFDEFSPARIN